MKPESKVDQFFQEIQFDQRSLETILTKFTERLGKDAHHAFRWADDAVRAAAKLSVIRDVLSFQSRLDSNEWTSAQMIAYLREKVMNRAKWPAHSTSPISNLAEEYETAAWAEMVELAVRRIEA